APIVELAIGRDSFFQGDVRKGQTPRHLMGHQSTAFVELDFGDLHRQLRAGMKRGCCREAVNLDAEGVFLRQRNGATDDRHGVSVHDGARAAWLMCRITNSQGLLVANPTLTWSSPRSLSAPSRLTSTKNASLGVVAAKAPSLIWSMRKPLMVRKTS